MLGIALKHPMGYVLVTEEEVLRSSKGFDIVLMML